MEDTGSYGLYQAPDKETADERAAALQQVLRGNQQAAALAALSGAKSMQPFAEYAGGQAKQQESELASAGQHRLQLAMQRAQMQRQQFNADRTYGLNAAKYDLQGRRADEAERHNRASEERLAAALASLNQRRAAMTAGEMTPDAIETLADIVGTTGDKSILTSRALAPHVPAILAKVKERYPNFNPAATAAGYKADAANLGKQVQQQANLNAFEGTASKNLDLMEELSKKIPDTGVPLFNGPLRYAAGKMGNTDVRAFETARHVALSETARVITQMSAAGVLSDHARDEAMSLIGPDSTKEQIRRAHEIVNQDMASRKTSVGEQVDAARASIAGRQAAPGTAAPAKAKAPGHIPTWNPQTRKLE